MENGGLLFKAEDLEVKLIGVSSHSVAKSSLPGSEFLLWEWIDYTVQANQPIRTIHGSDKTSFFPGNKNFAIIRYANRLGRTALVVDTENGSTEPCRLEILSQKFPTETSHKNLLTRILGDLMRRTQDPSFAPSAPTSFGALQDPRGPTPLSDFHTLQRLAREIETAVENIINRPHRQLISVAEVRRIWEVDAVTPDLIYELITTGPEIQRTNVDWPLAKQLGGWLPNNIQAQISDETFDTPVNRFTVYILGEIDDALSRIRNTRWLQEVAGGLTWLQQSLSQLRSSSFLANVVPASSYPPNSQVFAKQTGYRELMECWLELTVGRMGVFGDISEAIDARDIASLYELWVFFVLADKLAAGNQCSPSFTQIINPEQGVKFGAEATLGGGWKLEFNNTFSRHQNRLRSYSVQLRPDYLLTRYGKPEVVFDAKFSFQQHGEGENVFTLADSDNHEAVANRQDLYKMHTYRDALNLRAAVVLYPGDHDEFYPKVGSVLEGPPGTIAVESFLSDNISGVGAVAIRP
jgi:predicted component of viral defense system (DUF524 family)